MRITVYALAAAAALCAFQPAIARDSGTINQASVYEQTMKFYPHPAHLFWSSEAPRPLGQHPAVLVQKQPPPTNPPAISTLWHHPALAGKTGQSASMASAARRAPIAGANPSL
jgi:hypothetical protein